MTNPTREALTSNSRALNDPARPLLLDLFCGAGGAAHGYWLAGFDVVGVDINPQPHYPYAFIQGDALEVGRRLLQDLDGLDIRAIHASPPCQRYSPLTKINQNHLKHPALIEPTRELLRESGLPYVLENVPGAPLVDPVALCGTTMCGVRRFGEGWFRIQRHRCFEVSWPIAHPPVCRCREMRAKGAEVLGVYGGGARQETRLRSNPTGGNTNKATAAQARDLMGMPWATRSEMNQAIPPAYTRWIGEQLMSHLRFVATPAPEPRALR